MDDVTFQAVERATRSGEILFADDDAGEVQCKADPALARILVATDTRKDGETEILKAYNPGVACYSSELIDITKLMIAVCSIPHFQVSIMTDAPQA